MHAAAESITLMNDVSQFGSVINISHDSEFVQVTIDHWPIWGHRTTYARAVRRREGINTAWSFAAAMARHIEEASMLVSSAALVHWLLDMDFKAVK